MQDLLDALKMGNNRAIKELYQSAYPACAELILNNEGTKKEARGLFQKAMVIFFRQIREPQFELTYPIDSYLYCITRNLWLRELKKRGKADLNLRIDESEQQLPELQDSDLELKLEIGEKHKYIAEIIDGLSEDCKHLLVSFYFKKMALKQIAYLMDYSESFVKVKKKRCMDFLKKKVVESYQATSEEVKQTSVKTDSKSN